MVVNGFKSIFLNSRFWCCSNTKNWGVGEPFVNTMNNWRKITRVPSRQQKNAMINSTNYYYYLIFYNKFIYKSLSRGFVVNLCWRLWASVSQHFYFSLKKAVFVITEIFWVLVIGVFRSSRPHRFWWNIHNSLAQPLDVYVNTCSSYCLLVVNDFSSSETSFEWWKVAKFTQMS